MRTLTLKNRTGTDLQAMHIYLSFLYQLHCSVDFCSFTLLLHHASNLGRCLFSYPDTNFIDKDKSFSYDTTQTFPIEQA